MKKYSILLLLILESYFTVGQSFTTNPPVHYPIAASAWEFTKFGDIGINEYKGLANISIPLHTLQVDEFTLPFSLDYYSGGIRVSEEAGLVGLGWSMNIPTIIQQIKDQNDYSYFTNHQKLPPYQGNPYLPAAAVFPPIYDFPWSENVSTLQTLGGIQDFPYYKNVALGILIDNNGYYNTNGQSSGKYLGMFGLIATPVDSEPDIFTVNINGEELKFCREASNRDYIIPGNYQLLPVKLLKGNIGYKIDLIPNPNPVSPTNTSSINGFLISDPKGNKYLFNKTEATRSGGFVCSINYKLTKITTLKGKEILFNYSEIVIVSEDDKIDVRYARRNGTTQNGYFYETTGILTTLNMPYPSYCGNFQNENIDAYCEKPVTLNYDYSFLNSIATPNQNIYFSYSGRLDNIEMKKLDFMKIENIFNEKVKKYDFTYDYFSSTTGSTKRLKLEMVKLEGNEPYSFEYNMTQLPNKRSYSIDYWGFYNGHNNVNLKPDLTQLGYPQYAENTNNDFNSNINFAKACTLEKIIYPTKGYTEFEYGLHTFDNLAVYQGSLTPIINFGGGLRINSITNYNSDNSIVNRKNYSYQGGKCINKRILTKQVTETVGQINPDGYLGFSLVTPCVLFTLNNFVNQNINSEGDYIGYDKVIIKDEGTVNIGKIEKIFANNINTSINPENGLFCDAMNYSSKSSYENGILLKEINYDASNSKVLEKSKSYYNIIQGQNTYGMSKQANGVKFYKNPADEGPEHFLTRGISLATFYPIFGKTSLLSKEIITEYFNGNSKTLITNYSYDDYYNITNTKTYEAGAIISETNTKYTFYPSINVFDLPDEITYREDAIIKDQQNFFYENTDFPKIIKIENRSRGNSTDEFTRKMYYDLYDSTGNILQYHNENGIFTCVVWGYNKTMPIVKIENLKYASIESLISTLQNASDSSDETSLVSALNNFRTTVSGQFADVMITTYTHKPLIGVSTITDPKGSKSTYEYDNANRLKLVRDNDGNIISKNQYNYRAN